MIIKVILSACVRACLYVLVFVCDTLSCRVGVQPGLPLISELIDKMMIHKSHLIAGSPGCADSGAGEELS